jgi:hypothetical protein
MSAFEYELCCLEIAKVRKAQTRKVTGIVIVVKWSSSLVGKVDCISCVSGGR